MLIPKPLKIICRATMARTRANILLMRMFFALGSHLAPKVAPRRTPKATGAAMKGLM